jgi:hypothetical protein
VHRSKKRSLKSGSGHKQTSRRSQAMSALPPKADIDGRGKHVRSVPILLQKVVDGLRAE